MENLTDNLDFISINSDNCLMPPVCLQSQHNVNRRSSFYKAVTWYLAGFYVIEMRVSNQNLIFNEKRGEGFENIF